VGFLFREEAILLFCSLSFQAPATFDSAPVPGGKVWADERERPENVWPEYQTGSCLVQAFPLGERDGRNHGSKQHSRSALFLVASLASQRHGLHQSQPVSRMTAGSGGWWAPSPALSLPHSPDPVMPRVNLSCVISVQPQFPLWTSAFSFFFSFWPCPVTCGILVPQPGSKPSPSSVEVQTLNC